ncbi:hypothetical protein [Thermus neutrinimicus]|uniref:hypothetical protein n=1 Tax=Thermus neutrinimicus TaxID=2908149 RepID=UPI001FAB1B84|nr:hypothetical protein [Thermus neutrinimicus]
MHRQGSLRAALRFGLLYLLALLLVFAVGHRNQMEKAHQAEMGEELARLKAQEEALLKEGWQATQPHRVLSWAKEQGFVPMSQGRWAP